MVSLLVRHIRALCQKCYTYHRHNYYPRPIGIDGRCLSVRLRVCPSVAVSDPKSRTEWHRMLNIRREEAHDTGDPWPHLEIKRSKVKVTSPINAVHMASHIFGTGRLANYKLGIRMEYDDPHHRHARWPPSWKLCSSHHLQGAGAYCGGPTGGRTVWFTLLQPRSPSFIFIEHHGGKLQTQILSVAKDGISYKWDVKPAGQTYVCG